MFENHPEITMLFEDPPLKKTFKTDFPIPQAPAPHTPSQASASEARRTASLCFPRKSLETKGGPSQLVNG